VDDIGSIWEGLLSSVGIWEAVIDIGFSLLFSITAYFMYQFFYGSRYIGAGVQRTFILGGPAITALFLGIQTSIPLSLGLLGALSFVRFRTPVKDPAEIGFLLLLVASSIGAATGNFMVTGLLFIVVFVCLSIQWMTRNRMTLFGRGRLMLSVDQEAYSGLEGKLGAFLRDRLSGLRMETMSVMDDRVNLQYQYRRARGFDEATFTKDLNQITGSTRVDIFVG